MILRDYQLACVESIIEQWKTVQSTIVVLYTGGGKTVIFSDLITRLRLKRALVIAHREELIHQAHRKILEVSGLDFGIEMADSRADDNLFSDNPGVIATVQTLLSGRKQKRMHRFKPEYFDIIIIDECHRSTSKSYVAILDYFKQNPNLKVVGFTATPKRADGVGMGNIFQSTAFDEDIREGINKGWLCNVTQQFIPVHGLDYSHIKTEKGDFNQVQLAAVMEAEENIAGVCHPALEVIYGLPPKTLEKIPVPEWATYIASLNRVPRRTIVFTVSVAQAEACSNIFNRVVSNISEFVCGTTDRFKRMQILGRFATGKTAIVVNVGVLTEGYDNPFVEVIIQARPTKSEILYRQTIGRSTRVLPGVVDSLQNSTPEERKAAIAASAKPFCRVVDLVGNSGSHTLVSCMDVLAGKLSSEARERVIKKAQGSGKPIKVMEALDRAEVDLRIEKEQEQKKQEEARKAKLVAKAKFNVTDVNPFGYSSVSRPTNSNGWNGSITPKQLKFIQRFNREIKDPHLLTKNQARGIISKKTAEWEERKH